MVISVGCPLTVNQKHLAVSVICPLTGPMKLPIELQCGLHVWRIIEIFQPLSSLGLSPTICPSTGEGQIRKRPHLRFVTRSVHAPWSHAALDHESAAPFTAGAPEYILAR